MAEPLKKCRACEGRGYFRCKCWPGDCICGVGDEDCDECGGEGIIDESYDPWDGHEPAGTSTPEHTITGGGHVS